MIIRLLLIVLVSITTTNLYSGTIDPNTSDQKYIEYGKEFHYVGKLCGTYEDGTKFCASAVAIDDNHILTSAHVVQNIKECFVEFGDKKYALKKIVSHEDFDIDKFGTADLAIAYSSESFNLKFYPELYKEKNEINKVCCISGYGLTGTFLTGAKIYDNKKRAGSNVVDKIENDMLLCSPSKKTDKNYTSLEFLIASGDSGGGLFIDNKLAGINSFVMSTDDKPNSSYGDESCHTRISIFRDWILQTLKDE